MLPRAVNTSCVPCPLSPAQSSVLCSELGSNHLLANTPEVLALSPKLFLHTLLSLCWRNGNVAFFTVPETRYFLYLIYIIKNDGSISQILLELAPHHAMSPIISPLTFLYPQHSAQFHCCSPLSNLHKTQIQPMTHWWGPFNSSQGTQVKSKLLITVALKLWLEPSFLPGSHRLFPPTHNSLSSSI